MIVAGEASGDGHAAKLVNALREAEPETVFDFFGAAGPKMRDAGVEAVVLSDGLSIVGLTEIGRALPTFLRAFQKLKDAAERRAPDAVILVDFPDFNLKLAKSLKKRGFTIIYFISPQLWAWRKYRVGVVKKYVDLMITILPFEKDWYLAQGVTHVEYVGSPLAREVKADHSKAEFCGAHGLDAAQSIIALLPGSRHKEIVRIFSVMLDAAAKMAVERPGVQFVVPISSNRNRPDVENALRRSGVFTGDAPRLKIVEHETYDALNASDAAAVTSGTATLETGIIGTPMVIVYKTSALNYRLFEPIIDVPHYGLINLIAEARVAPELIQDNFTATTLADELTALLEPERNARMRERLKMASEKLGHGGASKRAADAVLRLLQPAAPAILLPD